jgi:hypothetical protein
MRQRRESRHELRRNELRSSQPLNQRRPLRVDQSLDGLETGVEPGCDEVLALAGEQPQLLALSSRAELADELEPRVAR